MTFKIGDKVEVVEKYNAHEVGEVGTITSINGHTNSYYRINGDKWGAPARKFKKVEDKPMFKIGDKVKILNNGHDPVHYFRVGSIVEVKNIYSNGKLYLVGNLDTDGASTQIVDPKCVEKVEDDLYEDGWILNDGKVTIPDDAQKSMHEGSVVAFRKRKVKPFEFGDKVKYKDGNIYLVIGKDQPGLYRIIKEGYIYSVTAFEENLTAIDDKEKV